MNRDRKARRSLLAGGMSALAGAWVFGAEAIAGMLAASTQSGCDPRAKYGGPPVEPILDASAHPLARPDPSPAVTAESPDAEPVGLDGAAPDALGKDAAPEAAPPPPVGPPKYGGPVRPKYGGPQPRKYGGAPPDDVNF